MRKYLAFGRPEELVWFFGDVLRCPSCKGYGMGVETVKLAGNRVGIPRESTCMRCGVVKTPFQLGAWNSTLKERHKIHRDLARWSGISVKMGTAFAEHLDKIALQAMSQP